MPEGGMTLDKVLRSPQGKDVQLHLTLDRASIEFEFFANKFSINAKTSALHYYA